MRIVKYISVAMLALLLVTLAAAQGRRRGSLPPPQRPTQPDRMPPAPPRDTPAPGTKAPAPAAPAQQPPVATMGSGVGLQRGGQRLGDWLRDHQNLPVDQQMKLLEQERAFQQLPPAQQQRLRERLQRFNSLPPDQRERRLQHLQRLEQLTPEQRQRAENLLDKFRVLPEGRRLQIGRAAGFLSRMDPQQQQRALDSPRMRNQFSDQEREMLRGILDLRIGPASPPPGPQD